VKSERVRAIRRLTSASFREQVQRFLIEGPQAVREALMYRCAAIDEIFVLEAPEGPAAEVAEMARIAGMRVSVVPENVLLAMTETVHPQGIAAVSSFMDLPLKPVLGTGQLLVFLDQVRDPGNAGTIVRTADAAGADTVIFGNGCVDPYNGKLVRSTAGSLFHVPITRGADVVETIFTVRGHGFQVLATSGSGDTQIPDIDLDRPTMWIFGNEAHGISAEASEGANHRVSIPMYGPAESLNLASAAAICLYASAQAQH